jgi:hypothetical protein
MGIQDLQPIFFGMLEETVAVNVVYMSMIRTTVAKLEKLQLRLIGEKLKVLFPMEHTDVTPLAAYENLRTFARR